MKKNKFKVLGFASLALLMACTGTFVFAPLTTSAHEEPTTTTGLGLDPKNDPVVYTTESGLEIKMSNANKFAGTVVTTSNMGASYTQDLTSFYYFTMGTFSGTIYTAKTITDSYQVTNEPVNWIILGVGSHSTAFVESVSNYLFSAIKNHDYLFENGEYFFDNQHETYSPAGQLINSTVNAKTYIMAKVKDSIKVHTDIPKGHMLVLSEKTLGQMYFNSTGEVNSGNIGGNPNYHFVSSSGGAYGNRYRYKGDIQTITTEAQTWNNKTDGSLYTCINNLFSKNTSGTVLKNGLGFTPEQANLIVPQQLYTYYSNGIGYDYQDTPSSDGGTYYTMFPLAWKGANTNVYQNFCVEDYLTTDNQRVATLIGNSSTQCDWWFLRSGYAYSRADSVQTGFVHPGGALHGDVTAAAAMGVRPAMVMKLS